MAEFQVVMKQAKRMCRKHKTCEDCALKKSVCPIVHIPSKWNANTLEEIERIVMDWAVKHPESRYPNWNEAWKQLFPESGNHVSPCPQYFISNSRAAELCEKMECNECRDTTIPADIAEKLGIKPIGGEADA